MMFINQEVEKDKNSGKIENKKKGKERELCKRARRMVEKNGDKRRRRRMRVDNGGTRGGV